MAQWLVLAALGGPPPQFSPPHLHTHSLLTPVQGDLILFSCLCGTGYSYDAYTYIHTLAHK